ncbi:MAG: winged helix-turn-helix domain-containing protein [Pikeienuella sp.]
MIPTLSNTTARRLFMDRHCLAAAPTRKQTKADLLSLINQLGFVQVDSIQTVERAHHMILFARNQTYRKENLVALIEQDRTLFENFTHDASIIPSRFFPYWQCAFKAKAPRLAERWKGYGREGFLEQTDTVLREIARRGPSMTREMGKDEARSSGGWWEWNPSKAALEYLWLTGGLCIARREGFQKVYDLTENVIPAEHLTHTVSREDLVEWACRAALDRLGFATPGDLAAFWALISPAEARAWATKQNHLIEIAIENADGSKPRVHFARPDLLDEITPEPPKRIRILSPFDPMIRDRKRTKRLFNFEYTIEVFVPAPKRKYGYYVFPMLEGDRLIGRIDMKADRATSTLNVTGLWLEPKIKFSDARRKRLEAELERQRRFAGLERIDMHEGWIK